MVSSTILIDRLPPVESRLKWGQIHNYGSMTFCIMLISVPSQKFSLFRPLLILLGRADQKQGLRVKQGINICFRGFLSITNCVGIIPEDLATCQDNLITIEHDMRESVDEFKNDPKREIFVRAFGSVISCNPCFHSLLSIFLQTPN